MALAKPGLPTSELWFSDFRLRTCSRGRPRDARIGLNLKTEIRIAITLSLKSFAVYARPSHQMLDLLTTSVRTTSCDTPCSRTRCISSLGSSEPIGRRQSKSVAVRWTVSKRSDLRESPRGHPPEG